jgi:phage shock protein PspC (stress-responsive transcriptional regulator)
MDLTAPLLTSLNILIALFGLSLGYHISQAFREIETYIGQPAFRLWFIAALKKSTQRYDIGLAGMIAGISLYLNVSPLCRSNAAILLFFMFLAAYWSDRSDAPPTELIHFAFGFIRKLLSGKLWNS